MKLNSLLVVVLSITLLSTSCSKEDDNSTTTTPTNNSGSNGGNSSAAKTQLLTATKWIPKDLTFNNVNAWNLVKDCERDNYLEFKTDGSFTEDEGATKCKQGDPQVVATSTWKFNTTLTRIVFNGKDAEINELSASELRIQYDDLGTIVIATYQPQ